MMIVPRKNSFDLLDDFFNDDVFTKRDRNLMKTDIIEKKDKYLLNIDLPGFSKDNIKISLENGYLNISAKLENEVNEEEDRFVRQERFFGECSRSFYLGDDIKEEDIDAKFENGILKVNIPKKDLIDKKDTIKNIEIK
ncbi:MAG: Hsp20/alpha crystallin family protein [Bacilli bacterium]|nr:Hsp20/alpha crystallin family protein [Bacilli bacterium]